MRRHWFSSMQSNLDGRHPDRFDKRRIISLTSVIADEGVLRVKVKKRLARKRNAAFDDLVITITCPTPTAWHNATSNTGGVMRKLFIFSALVFVLVTGATATAVATTLQSQSALADTTH